MKHAFKQRRRGQFIGTNHTQSPEGNLIPQPFGNSATVARERDGFLALVRSIAPAAP